MREMKVDAIKDGSVIDHLPPGKALDVIRILHPAPEASVLLGTNLGSAKMGAKDIVKIVNYELSRDELNTLALLAPDATLTIIRDYKIHQKSGVELPSEVNGLFGCPNPKCVTNAEPVETRFKLMTGPAHKLKCHYCEKVYMASEVVETEKHC